MVKRERQTLTIGEVLLAIVQVLVGGLAGHALEARQDRAHTLYCG